MENFKKTVLIGCGDSGNVFCTIEYKNDKLSITGVEGPQSNGNARGSCGQINMNGWGIKTYAEGWNPVLEAEFRQVWDKYHLNDMHPGSPSQTAYLEANPVKWKYPEDHYTKALETLQAAGLSPDPQFIHNGKPYKYGNAWLSIEVPANVLEFLSQLPEAKIEMPRCWL